MKLMEIAPKLKLVKITKAPSFGGLAYDLEKKLGMLNTNVRIERDYDKHWVFRLDVNTSKFYPQWDEEAMLSGLDWQVALSLMPKFITNMFDMIEPGHKVKIEGPWMKLNGIIFEVKWILHDLGKIT